MTTSKDARFWDRAARKYARSAITDQAGYELTLDRTRAHLSPGDRVLELACGTGTTALRLAGGVESYLATDISSGMIAIAREKLAQDPVPGLRFDVGTAASMTGTALFDAVLGFNYLHLVHDLPGTLQRIHGLLAPGGLFISKTPCIGAMNVFIRAAIPVMRAVGKAPHVTVFRPSGLKREVESAGFDVVAVEDHSSKGDGFRPYIVARKA